MQANYKAFGDRMITRYEGGYGWDAGDSGGPTKYGITCYDLAEHRHQKMTSMSAWAPLVRAMTLSEAEDIYRVKYATAMCFDQLPSGMDCCIFDYGVNSGISRSIMVAAAIVGVKQPGYGYMSRELLAKLQTYPVATFVKQMDAERMAFLRKLRIWSTFGKGWTARVNDLDAYCMHLASNKPAITAPTSAPVATTGISAKGVVASRSPATVAKGAAATAAVTGGAVGAGFPHWAIGAVVGVGLASAIGYGVYEAYQDKAIADAVHL